jgi:hypothetical protein
MFEVTIGVVAGVVAAGFFLGMILFRTYFCGLSYTSTFVAVQDGHPCR